MRCSTSTTSSTPVTCSRSSTRCCVVSRPRVTPSPPPAAAFGLSRPSFYEARTAWQREGLAGLLPKKRGPRRGHKLTPEVVAFLERRRAEDAHVSAASLVREVEQRYGVRVHPRSVERALRRQEKKLP